MRIEVPLLSESGRWRRESCERNKTLRRAQKVLDPVDSAFIASHASRATDGSMDFLPNPAAVGLKRACPFDAHGEPMRKTHVSEKENELRDPAARRAAAAETANRLFLAANGPAAACQPLAADPRLAHPAASRGGGGVLCATPCNTPQPCRRMSDPGRRRVTFADEANGMSHRSPPAAVGGNDDDCEMATDDQPPARSAADPASRQATLDQFLGFKGAPRAAAPARGCISCLRTHQLLLTTCQLCSKSVCVFCCGLCDRCGVTACGNCAFGGGKDSVTGNTRVICGGCHSMVA